MGSVLPPPPPALCRGSGGHRMMTQRHDPRPHGGRQGSSLNRALSAPSRDGPTTPSRASAPPKWDLKMGCGTPAIRRGVRVDNPIVALVPEDTALTPAPGNRFRWSGAVDSIDKRTDRTRASHVPLGYGTWRGPRRRDRVALSHARSPPPPPPSLLRRGGLTRARPPPRVRQSAAPRPVKSPALRRRSAAARPSAGQCSTARPHRRRRSSHTGPP